MDDVRTTVPPSARTGLATAALLAAIVAVALNQRPAVVSVAPVLSDLRADTGLSGTMAGACPARTQTVPPGVVSGSPRIICTVPPKRQMAAKRNRHV